MAQVEDAMTAAYQTQEVMEFVQRCQVAVGEWSGSELAQSLDNVWSCLRSQPACVEFADRVAFSIVILRVAVGLHTRLRVLSPDQSDAARRRMVKRRRGEQLLSLIWLRHRDTVLSLESLASQMGMSEPDLSRTLTTASAYGFATHLSGFRIIDSVVLLSCDQLLVKQVAWECGFGSTGELDRQFNLWLRMTPRTFRSAIVSACDYVGAGSTALLTLANGNGLLVNL